MSLIAIRAIEVLVGPALGVIREVQPASRNLGRLIEDGSRGNGQKTITAGDFKAASFICREIDLLMI